MKAVHYLRLDNGHSPFLDWHNGLTLEAQIRINAYIDRVAAGGARKNIRSVGDQVFEIKIALGPGYRVYFGKTGEQIILLLCGGDKDSQMKDILRAKQYWRHYRASK